MTIDGGNTGVGKEHMARGDLQQIGGRGGGEDVGWGRQGPGRARAVFTRRAKGATGARREGVSQAESALITPD